MKMTASGRFATSAGRGELYGFRASQMMIYYGGSFRVVRRIRPPPEPPSLVVRDARVCESFPISFHYFVILFLVIVYVVRFVSLFGNLALFYVIEHVWIYGNTFGCVKPITWLAIRVALSGVTVSNAHHRVYSRSCWSLVG
ncbi:unnamed protein product, partial [Cuscuta epithymum]